MPAASDKSTASSMPFAGALTDSLELMRKVWGLSGLPSLPSSASMTQFAQALPQSLPAMIAPTLDVNEIDKRITDLRAVEQWLTLNVNVLRTTIQGLEVQRNTLAALKSFGGSMLAATQEMTASAASPPDTPAQETAPPPAANTLPLNALAWWSGLQEQFAKMTSAVTANAASSASQSAKSKPTASKSTATARKKTASATPRKRRVRKSTDSAS